MENIDKKNDDVEVLYNFMIDHTVPVEYTRSYEEFIRTQFDKDTKELCIEKMLKNYIYSIKEEYKFSTSIDQNFRLVYKAEDFRSTKSYMLAKKIFQMFINQMVSYIRSGYADTDNGKEISLPICINLLDKSIINDDTKIKTIIADIKPLWFVKDIIPTFSEQGEVMGFIVTCGSSFKNEEEEEKSELKPEIDMVSKVFHQIYSALDTKDFYNNTVKQLFENWSKLLGSDNLQEFSYPDTIEIKIDTNSYMYHVTITTSCSITDNCDNQQISPDMVIKTIKDNTDIVSGLIDDIVRRKCPYISIEIIYSNIEKELDLPYIWVIKAIIHVNIRPIQIASKIWGVDTFDTEAVIESLSDFTESELERIHIISKIFYNISCRINDVQFGSEKFTGIIKYFFGKCAEMIDTIFSDSADYIKFIKTNTKNSDDVYYGLSIDINRNNDPIWDTIPTDKEIQFNNEIDNILGVRYPYIDIDIMHLSKRIISANIYIKYALFDDVPTTPNFN